MSALLATTPTGCGATVDQLFLELSRRRWRGNVRTVHSWDTKGKQAFEATCQNNEKAFSRYYAFVVTDADTPFRALRKAIDECEELERRKRLPEKDPESFYFRIGAK